MSNLLGYWSLIRHTGGTRIFVYDDPISLRNALRVIVIDFIVSELDQFSKIISNGKIRFGDELSTAVTGDDEKSR